jgi:hypothetical protein
MRLPKSDHAFKEPENFLIDLELAPVQPTDPEHWDAIRQQKQTVEILNLLPAKSQHELVGGNDELSVGVAAHTVDGARDTCADGVGVTARMLGRDSDRPIRAANNRTLVVKRIRLVEVDDETRVFGTCRESDGGIDLYAERFVGFGTGDTRRRCGVGALASPDINGARRGSGSARIDRCASACGIGRGANVIFDFVGVFANDNTRQQNRQGEKTANNCKIAINLHWLPHTINSESRTCMA